MVIRRGQRHDLGYAHVAEPIGSDPGTLAGYSMEPTPMIAPWPCHQAGNRMVGSDGSRVGQVIVVPAKSSTSVCPLVPSSPSARIQDQNWAKSSASHFLMLGTNS